MKALTLLDIAMANDGHRASYVAFLGRLFDVERLGFCWRAVFSRRPVLVTMIEDSLALYVLAALVRSLLGRRTAGLLFLPKRTIDGGSLRLRTKYCVLRALRQLPHVRTLVLLPFEVEPRFAEIAHGWIYDPQLWDLDRRMSESAGEGARELSGEVRRVAAGRRVCLALGRQDRSKGFDWLMNLYLSHAGLRDSLLLGFGGEVHDGLGPQMQAFQAAGGFACDRLVTDDELLALYSSADLIWCAYAPSRDQASGIFGRAVQLGIPVVVRRGSLLHRLCGIEGIVHVAIGDAGDWQGLVAALQREPGVVSEQRTGKMRARSMAQLEAALWGGG